VSVGGLPSASFSLQSTLGQTAVTTANNSAEADSYFWDFGDGSTSTALAPEHSYAGDGAYTVTLIASNACGSDTAVQTVEIVTPPAAGFSLSAASGCAPFTVAVTDGSSANATAWSWSAPGAEPASSEEQNPSFTYASPGVYTIYLEASNAAGSSQDSLEVSVGGLPSASFSLQSTLGQTAVTTANNSAEADSYFWDFGDGSTSTALAPEHSYAGDGAYTVTLIASNACGSDTAVQTVEIVTPPAAGFSLSAASGCAPFTVAVTDGSSANATAWSWSAPGAEPATSEEQNPSFTYASPGVYTIYLEASNAAGSSQDSLEVSVGGLPSASFSLQSTSRSDGGDDGKQQRRGRQLLLGLRRWQHQHRARAGAQLRRRRRLYRHADRLQRLRQRYAVQTVEIVTPPRGGLQPERGQRLRALHGSGDGRLERQRHGLVLERAGRGAGHL
jgi:PKD repeat protein